MFENYSSFDDIVRRYQLARMEGLLLRYLNQVHSTLSRNIPEALQTEGVRDLIAYLRAVLSRVDSSLVEEWESLAKSKPPALADADPVAAPASGGRVLDTRELETRIRTELHLLVRALSVGNYAEAANCVRQDPNDSLGRREIRGGPGRLFPRVHADSLRSGSPSRPPHPL